MLKKGLERLSDALRKPEPVVVSDLAPLQAESQPRVVEPEPPQLWVGTAGFNASQKAMLDQQVADSPPDAPRWASAPFAQADVWLINSLKAKMVGGHGLKVEPGVPHERSLQINLQELDRPLACSAPSVLPDASSIPTFEWSGADIGKTLAGFEAALAPLLAQYTLGCLIASQPRRVRSGVFHLTHGQNLIATLDFQNLVAGVWPRAQASHFQACQWERKPLSAGRPPPSFNQFAIGELTWLYALRTRRDLLPSRYRTKQIFFRHAPQVRPAWLHTSHRTVLQELSAHSFSFEQLRQRTALPSDRLAQALACLYYAGTITTSREKAHAALSESQAFETQSPPSADLANSVFIQN